MILLLSSVDSFKDRGAIFTLLNLPEKYLKKGVITTSAGNHAQALAHQGRKLKVPVTVVMPKTAPLVKVSHNCRKDRKSMYAIIIIFLTL